MKSSKDREKFYKKLGLIYSKIENPDEVYTEDSSSGQIAFEQIIEGSDEIYVSQALDVSLEKKKIIFRDWNIFTWSYVNILKIRSFYNQLKKDGFKIYIIDPVALSLIEFEDSDNNFQYARYKYFTEREVIDITARHGFTKDEIFIAGPFDSARFIESSIVPIEFGFRKDYYEELCHKGNIEIILVESSSLHRQHSFIPEEYSHILSLADHMIVYMDDNEFLSPLLAGLTNAKSILFQGNIYHDSYCKIPDHIRNIGLSLNTAFIDHYSTIGKLLNFNEDILPYKHVLGIGPSLINLYIKNYYISYGEFGSLLIKFKPYSIQLKEVLIFGESSDLAREEQISLNSISFDSSGSFEKMKILLQNINAKELTIAINSAWLNKEYPVIKAAEESLSYKSQVVSYVKKIINYFYNSNQVLETKENTKIKLDQIKSVKITDKFKMRDLECNKEVEMLLKDVLDSFPNLESLDLQLFNSNIDVDIPNNIKVTGLRNSLTPKNYYEHSLQVDTRTKGGNHLHDTRVFKPKANIAVYSSDYRMGCSRGYNLFSGKYETRSKLASFKEVHCEPKGYRKLEEIYDKQFSYSSKYFLGKVEYPAREESIALPTLTPYDKIISVQDGNNKNYCTVICDKETDLFYLKIPNVDSKKVIYYLIESPYADRYSKIPSMQDIFRMLYNWEINVFYPVLKELQFDDNGRLTNKELYNYPKDIQISLLNEYCSNFVAKELPEQGSCPKDNLNSILKYQAGVCRHGALAFSAVAEELGMKEVRVIDNQIHAFIEVKNQRGIWENFDLGGVSDANIQADENGWENIPQKIISQNTPMVRDSQEDQNIELTDIQSSWFKIYSIKEFITIVASAVGLALLLIHYEILEKMGLRKIINELKPVDLLNFLRYKLSNIINFLGLSSNKDDNPQFLQQSNYKNKYQYTQPQNEQDSIDYLTQYKSLLIITAACGSIGLMVMVARYFYNQANPSLTTEKAESDPIKLLDNDVKQEVKILENTKQEIVEDEKIENKIQDKAKLDDVLIPKKNPFMDSITSQESSAKTMEEYVLEIIELGKNLEKKNILCILNEDQIEDFYATYLEVKKQEVLIVPDLDEITSHDSVIRTGGEIEYIDSRIVKFIKDRKEGTIILDWSKCKPQNIGFNSITDEIRRLESTYIDPETVIISLLKTGVKMGDDFYSRSGVTRKLSSSVRSSLKVHKAFDNERQAEIRFFGENWKHDLFGRVKISEEAGYIYKHAEIIDHIKAGVRNLILRNAPWQNLKFRLAIKDIEEKGSIYIKGQEYECSGIKFIADDRPYSLEDIELVEFNPQEEYQIINQATFPLLFENYYVKENNELKILDKPTEKTLFITDALTHKQWVKLASIKAKIVVAEIDELLDNPFPSNKAFYVDNIQARIIITDDLSLLAKKYSLEGKAIIYISKETKASDLIEIVSYDKYSKKYYHKISCMAELLLAGKEVVLAGDPSVALLRQLESLFLAKPYMIINGVRVTFPGKLIIASSEYISRLGWIKEFEQSFFTDEDKFNLVKEEYHSDLVKKLENIISSFNGKLKKPIKFSYNQIDSMLNRMIKKPYSNPLKHILRLEPDYNKELKPVLEEIWPKELREKTSRLEKIAKEFEISDIVFIAGPTGAGKTTILKELEKQYHVHRGMNNLGKLSLSSKDGKPVLVVIDEANLESKPNKYRVLEGIYHSRYFSDKGELKEVKAGNKVLLLGNYGHFIGRKSISLIQEHGSIISFKPLDDVTLKIGVIQPILEKLILEDSNHFDEITNLFIAAYHHINKLFPEKELLTPRNLEMMSFRYRILSDKKIEPYNVRAAIAIYDEIACKLEQKECRDFRIWLENKATVSSIEMVKQNIRDGLNIDQLFIADSRKDALLMLECLLAIRELKKLYPELKGLGVNGLLYEGEAGIGKSYTPIEYLKLLGYDFDLITPTSFLKAKEVILQAFENDNILMIDEINTMPLEELLNYMLSSGLTGVFTQNPISYSNRIAFSPAFTNRLQKLVLEELKDVELKGLARFITNNQVSENLVGAIVKYYLESIEYAKKHNLPVPNLRHFRNCINDILAQKDLINSEEENQVIIVNEIMPIQDLPVLPLVTTSKTIMDNQVPISSTLNLEQEVVVSVTIEKSFFENVREFIDNFGKTTDNSVRKFIDNSFKSFLFHNVYLTKQEIEGLQAIINKPHYKFNPAILNKPIAEWTSKDINKALLAVHPDKHLDNELKKIANIDSIALNNFKESIDPDNLYKKLQEKLDISAELGKFNIYLKGTDIVVDIAKTYLKPGLQNSFQLGYDSLMLASKYYPNAKLGYVLPIISTITIGQDIYNGEYLKAGINAIHGFSYFLVNNPLLSWYGTPIYLSLNGVVIANDIYNGKYLEASVQAVGMATMCVSPTIATTIFAVSYTAKNIYDLYNLYNDDIFYHGLISDSAVNHFIDV